jgi:hypothetical protein
MAHELSLTQIATLTFYALAMTAGQIFFKLAALTSPPAGDFGSRLLGLARNGFFAAAIALYAVLAIMWVWILSFTPLSQAYLFVAIFRGTNFAAPRCWYWPRLCGPFVRSGVTRKRGFGLSHAARLDLGNCRCL